MPSNIFGEIHESTRGRLKYLDKTLINNIVTHHYLAIRV
jgi:hypothetical protein